MAKDKDYLALPKLGQETPLHQSNKKYKVKQRLTIPLFSIAHQSFMMILVKGEMYEGDMSIGGAEDTAGKPTLMLVTDLDKQIDGLLICNEIIRSSLLHVDGGYVGKVFQLRSGDIKPGKRYREVDIVLMEEE